MGTMVVLTIGSLRDALHKQSSLGNACTPGAEIDSRLHLEPLPEEVLEDDAHPSWGPSDEQAGVGLAVPPEPDDRHEYRLEIRD